MISVYKIKPKFQKLLQPILVFLRKIGVSPNQITILTVFFSIALGVFLFFAIENKIWFLFVSLGLLLRMALNSLDGMMAKQYNLQSKKGEILNELVDVISDVAIFFPFIYFESLKTEYVIIFIVLSIITLLFLFGAFLMKESPEEMNLEPYGGKFPKEEDDIENSWSSSSAIKTLSFNILYLQLVLGMLSFLIVVTFQYDLALERGFNILTSSLAPASIAAGSFFGRLVAGFLSDYVDRNKILFSVFLGKAL